MSRRARNVGSSAHRQHNESANASAPYTDVAREMNVSNEHNNRGPVSDTDFQPSDMVILRALLDGRNSRNMSCEEILDSLDGVNRHTSDQWIRYFLRNIRMVELYSHPEGPSNSSMTPQGTSASTSESTLVDRSLPVAQRLYSNRTQAAANQPDVPPQTRTPNNPGRARRDYLDHEPVSVENIDLDADDADSSDSDSRASRSPTPPKTTIKWSSTRFKYTEEDIEFCIKMGQHMLRQNPDISLEQIAEKVHEKAPHHSYLSWRTQLIKNPDIVQQMRRVLKKTVLCVCRDDSSDDEQQYPTASITTPQHCPDSETDVEDDSIMAENTIEDAPGDATDDERKLGPQRSIWQPAERRVLARYIALHPQDWSQKPLGENIRLFHKEYSWSRTESAWAQYYRSHKRAIDSLARRIKLQPRSNTNGKKRAFDDRVSAKSPTSHDPSPAQRSEKRTEMESKISQHTSHQHAEYTGAEVSDPSSNVPQSSFKRKAPDSGFESSHRETDANDSESFSPSKRTSSGIWPWSLLGRS